MNYYRVVNALQQQLGLIESLLTFYGHNVSKLGLSSLINFKKTSVTSMIKTTPATLTRIYTAELKVKDMIHNSCLYFEFVKNILLWVDLAQFGK